MAEKRLVVVCRDACQFDRTCRDLSTSGDGWVRGVLDVDDLAQVVDDVEVGLVVYVQGMANDRSRVDRVLWHVTRAQRPVPVVVIADFYDEAEALTWFQMGVADYLSLADHRDRLARVVAELAGPSVEGEPVAAAQGEHAQRAWKSPLRAVESRTLSA